MSDALARLLSPLDKDTFFSRHWTKEPLYLARKGEDYAGVLTLSDLDAFLQLQHLPAAYFDLIRGGERIPMEEWSRPGQAPRGTVLVAVPELLLKFYRKGATLIINGAHQDIAALGLFCCALESQFGCPVQANIYITPSGAQGFNLHKDETEILILQISGSKNWRLYLPEKPVREIILRAGDLLYMPRGLCHEAESHDTHSIHVTVGIKPVYAFQLVEAIAEIAREAPSFQRAVPGAARQAEEWRTFADEFFRDLEALIGSTSATDLLDRRADAFVANRYNIWTGRLLDSLRLPTLTLETVVCRREAVASVVEDTGRQLRLKFAGRHVDVPYFLRSSIDQITSGIPFIVRDLHGLVSDAGKVSLARTLVEKGLLRILDPRKASKAEGDYVQMPA